MCITQIKKKLCDSVELCQFYVFLGMDLLAPLLKYVWSERGKRSKWQRISGNGLQEKVQEKEKSLLSSPFCWELSLLLLHSTSLHHSPFILSSIHPFSIHHHPSIHQFTHTLIHSPLHLSIHRSNKCWLSACCLC